MAPISVTCSGSVCTGTDPTARVILQRLQELINQLAARLGVQDRVNADGVINEATAEVLQLIALDVPRQPLASYWDASPKFIATNAPVITAALELELRAAPTPGGTGAKPPTVALIAAGPRLSIQQPPSPNAPQGPSNSPQVSAMPGFIPEGTAPYLAAAFGLLAVGGVTIFMLRRRKRAATAGDGAVAGVSYGRRYGRHGCDGCGGGWIVRYTLPDKPEHRYHAKDRRTGEIEQAEAQTIAKELRVEGARNVRIVRYSERGRDDEFTTSSQEDPQHASPRDLQTERYALAGARSGRRSGTLRGTPGSMGAPGSMDEVMRQIDGQQLNELWHLSRTALSGKNASAHARKQWVAEAYAKAHPEIGSSTGVYKAMERLHIGELTYGTPLPASSDHLFASPRNRRRRR